MKQRFSFIPGRNRPGLACRLAGGPDWKIRVSTPDPEFVLLRATGNIELINYLSRGVFSPLGGQTGSYGQAQKPEQDGDWNIHGTRGIITRNYSMLLNHPPKYYIWDLKSKSD